MLRNSAFKRVVLVEKSRSITASLIWKFLERFSVQVIQFMVSIVIARILVPEEYGVMAILNVFISISSAIVQSGLSQYLIQKKCISSTDYSTVLISSMLISILLYSLIYLCSPYIGSFFKMEELPVMLKVIALQLFITPFTSVQMSYIRRNMLFDKMTFASLIAVICSGFFGVISAKNGMGTWALIIQQLLYNIILFILLLFCIKYKPSISFDLDCARLSFRFGFKLLIADIVDKVYHSLVSIIIGRNFSKATLAFFDRGKQFPLILIDNIDGSVQSVLYPAYSRLQDKQVEMKNLLRKSIRMSTYLSFISMAFLLVVSDSLIYILLGTKWMSCVPYLKAYCIITMLFPLQTTLLQSFIAMGKSSLYSNLILLKRLIGALLLLLVVFISKDIFSIIGASLIIEVCSIIMILFPARNLLDYHLYELVKDILVNLLIAVVVICSGLFVSDMIENHYISLIVVSILSLVIVVFVSLIARNESFLLICQKLGFPKH